MIFWFKFFSLFAFNLPSRCLQGAGNLPALLQGLAWTKCGSFCAKRLHFCRSYFCVLTALSTFSARSDLGRPPTPRANPVGYPEKFFQTPNSLKIT
jgi:hypothetical protein